jgi:hypothetical protein
MGRQRAASEPRFDYNREAELYSLKSIGRGRSPLGCKRFAWAADAILFAIEQLPSHLFFGTSLEVDDERYVAKEIRVLYESPYYPLARHAASLAG